MVFAVSAVLQQRGAREVPADQSLRPTLLLTLLRRGDWLAGFVAMVLAYGLQALALGLGPVDIVEPVITCELVFAVPIAVRLHGHRPGRREWLGIAAVSAGLSCFLLGSSPTRGTTQPSLAHWLYGFVPCVVIGAVLVVLARGPESPRRAALLAGAAGLSFGLLALVTKSATGLLSHEGLVALLKSWRPEALLVIGVGGFLVAQSAYQAAPLASSLPIIDAVEPISAVLLATFVLNERLTLGAGHLVLETAGAAGAVAGIFLLGSSPIVLAIYESGQRKKRDDRASGTPHDAKGTLAKRAS